jgi:predicted Zn-dependent protease
MKRLKILVTISFFITAVVLIISCAVNPVTGKRQMMLMSEAQEVALGAQYDPQVIATFGEYDDAKLESFLQSKATEMGLISHRPKLQYHVKILDSPVVNAFATPGGYIYFTRGILAQFTNEAEVMGVLGHEMGHIAARHSVSQQSKQTIGTLLLITGMVVSEELAKYAEYAMQGMQLLFLKFSRDDERQADTLGVEYSSKIGYDAQKMADFFQVLNKMSMAESEGGVPTFLSTHPNPVDRYNYVKKDAKLWQDRLNLPSWKVNGDSYLQMINGIVYGEDPRQGYVEGNIFYHPELKFMFSFPSGWKYENMPTQVNFGPENQKALMIFTFAMQKTLQTAADSTLKQLGQTLVSSEKKTVNGMPAIATVSKQTSQDQTTGQQQTIMVLSYFIDYNGNFYVIHGVSSDADFDTYNKVFESNMTTFKKLTDPAKINVKPERIIVKKIERMGTLSEAFTSLGVKTAGMDKLALLNEMELTDKVQPGKLIKIIGE